MFCSLKKGAAMAIKSWIQSPLQRIFPHDPAGRSGSYQVEAALNERFSFQLGLRLQGRQIEREPAVRVRVEVRAPKGWQALVRRVGHVPVPHRNTNMPEDDTDGFGHYPGFVPDPLFEEDSLLLPPAETQAFYITCLPGRAARPGRHRIMVDIYFGNSARPDQAHQVGLKVHPLRIKPRQGFPVTNWFYADALIDWYKTDLFDRRFWQVLPAYFRNMAEHGQDTVYVPVFTPPLDGVKRPSQLLRVTRSGKDQYRFDWRDVKKYVDLARTSGIRNFEWSHLFTQWGVKHALRIYQGQGREEKLLWRPDTGATSPTYRHFLSQFLPRLHQFCLEEKLLKKSFFHVSDEPHGSEHQANYIQARKLLQELAPWMKVMDALSEIEYGRRGLTDMPIPSIKTALDFARKGLRAGAIIVAARGNIISTACLIHPWPRSA
jgi:hypothetical protein